MHTDKKLEGPVLLGAMDIVPELVSWTVGPVGKVWKRSVVNTFRPKGFTASVAAIIFVSFWITKERCVYLELEQNGIKISGSA